MLTWRRLFIVCVLLLPLSWMAPSYGDATHPGDNLSGSPVNEQVTSVASVMNRTAREREMRVERAHAESRQKTMLAGFSVPRALEIAIHPMFMLALIVPWLWRRPQS